jgi:hypothetical protein
MAGDRAARRVAHIRKWGELTERYGSDEEAWYAIKESPEWELTYGLYPFGMLDEGRRALALDLMIDAEVDKPELKGEPGSVDHDVEPKGARVPYELAEQALQLHEQDRRLGRRRLAARLPGLTEWYADQVLAWHKVGKPVGLWLEEGRLRWGVSITPIWQDREQRGQTTSPTPHLLVLPRL